MRNGEVGHRLHGDPPPVRGQMDTTKSSLLSHSVAGNNKNANTVDVCGATNCRSLDYSSSPRYKEINMHIYFQRKQILHVLTFSVSQMEKIFYL